MDLEAIKNIYDKTARVLEDIGFLAQFESDAVLQKIKLDAVGTAKPTRGLFLGLGRFRKNTGQAQVSCVQLCAFQRIMQVFGLSGKEIVVHDPVFNETDNDFINTFGYDLVTDPALALATLACEEPTIVYHPFLPLQVLEQIFVQNWKPELLKNLILFGNGLSDWLSDPILRFDWTRQMFEHSQTPCLDKCLLLLDVTSPSLFGTEEMRNLSIDKDKDWEVEELVPIVASQVSKWRFEWIPAYRVYAMGEKFWHIRPVKASRWKELRNKEKCDGEDRLVESAAT